MISQESAEQIAAAALLGNGYRRRGSAVRFNDARCLTVYGPGVGALMNAWIVYGAAPALTLGSSIVVIVPGLTGNVVYLSPAGDEG